MPFESDYYRDQVFACGNKKCKATLVPLQVRHDAKDEEAIIKAKCPGCGKTFTFGLSLAKAEADQWRDLLVEQANKCAECGAARLRTVKSEGNPHKEYKIKVECVECGKKSDRYVDGDLYFLLEKDLPPAERLTIQCPTCGETVDDTKPRCQNCGHEIYCNKCHALVPPGARFCTRCRDPVETGDLAKKPLAISKDASGVCFTCGAVLADRQKYCTTCGQEVACDKCGERIAPGAVFCNACGDKVRQGKKA